MQASAAVQQAHDVILEISALGNGDRAELLVFFRICPFGILVNQPQHLQLPDESFLAGHVRMNQQLDHEGYPLLTLRLAQRAQKFFQCAEAGVQLGAYVGVDHVFHDCEQAVCNCMLYEREGIASVVVNHEVGSSSNGRIRTPSSAAANTARSFQLWGDCSFRQNG